jgi:hypothetical protein
VRGGDVFSESDRILAWTYYITTTLSRAPCVGLGFLVRLRFASRSLAVWRVCAIALSFVSGWRAFSSVSLCTTITTTTNFYRQGSIPAAPARSSCGCVGHMNYESDTILAWIYSTTATTNFYRQGSIFAVRAPFFRLRRAHELRE